MNSTPLERPFKNLHQNTLFQSEKVIRDFDGAMMVWKKFKQPFESEFSVWYLTSVRNKDGGEI